MADLKVTGGLPAPRTATTPPVRAAQRAFFDAALNKASVAAPVARQTAPALEVAQAPRRTASPPIEPVQSGRLLRPGSFFDIKV